MATQVTLSQPASQEHKIITLKPDGTELSGFADDYITTPFTLSTKGAIAELKQGQISIDLDYYGGQDWDDKDIFFNPALFAINLQSQPNPGQPNPGFKFHIQPGLPAGEYPMNWYGCLGNDYTLRNYSCTVTFTDNTSSIIINHSFYTTYDVDGFLACTSETNKRRFLRSKRLDANDLDVSATSVYGGLTKYYGYYVFVKDTVANYSGSLYNYAHVAFGMLNKSYSNGSPDWTEPTFEFSVAGVDSDLALSHLNNTKVRFHIHNQHSHTPTNAFAWLIRTDNALTGNTDWLSEYDASFAEIITDAGTTTLANAIKAPSTNWNNYSGGAGGYWDITFNIDPTEIIMNAKYRVIVVMYANPVDVSPFSNQYVNSFISDELTAFFIPEYDADTCPQYEFTKQIIDYKNTLEDTDCITTVPEDRLKLGGNVLYDGIGAYDADSMETCLWSRLGLELPNNDPRKYLKKITVEIYEEYDDGFGDTHKNVYSRESIIRTGYHIYSIPDNFEFYSTDWLTNFNIFYNFRVRYEAYTSCMESYLNGVSIPVADNQNWIGKTLFVKFSFQYDYHDLLPGITEIYSNYFTVCVAPYDNDVETEDQVLAVGGCGTEVLNVGHSTTIFDCGLYPSCVGQTTPDAAFIQALGKLPTPIPIGLRIIFLSDYPTYRGLYQWDGSAFFLVHEIEDDEVYFVDTVYSAGLPVVLNQYYTFGKDEYVRSGTPPSDETIENCDNIFICKGDTICIDVTLTPPEGDCEEYFAIATIDRPLFGIINIQEEENDEGNLEQLSSQHLELSNSYFGDNPYKPCVAEICIDSTNLVTGQNYKVSIIAKREL